MMIQDNGKGFDTGQPREGNGLKNMKKRAEEMGAHFMIDSQSGKWNNDSVKSSCDN